MSKAETETQENPRTLDEPKAKRAPPNACLRMKGLPPAKSSGGEAGVLPSAVGLELPKKAVEFWFAGKAIAGPRNSGVQNERARKSSPPLATFAKELTATL